MSFSRVFLTSAAFAAVLVAAPAVRADTLNEALALTYSNNPTLNAQRAALRATDEGVPQALSGYRPVVSGTASIGYSSLNTSAGAVNLNPRSVGITVEQPLFRAFRPRTM